MEQYIYIEILVTVFYSVLVSHVINVIITINYAQLNATNSKPSYAGEYYYSVLKCLITL